MAYRFPLAAVLRLRQTLERQEERALQKIVAELSLLQQRIVTLTDDIARARQLLEQAIQRSLAAADIESMTMQIDGSIKHKQELLQSLAELQQKRDAQNRKYQAAYNNRKMLSDMQARQIEAYEQDRDRTEQKQIDEIFAFRAHRR